MQVHKMIRSRLETCWENIHTLGDGKEHLRFSGFFYLSFNRHGFATAFLRHVALTKPQPSRMHCKKVKNFSQRLWIWAALCCKGFDNSTSRKYDEHSTSRHSKHTPLEGSLSSELVCLRNKSGSFHIINTCAHRTDFSVCVPGTTKCDNGIGATSFQQGLEYCFIGISWSDALFQWTGARWMQDLHKNTQESRWLGVFSESNVEVLWLPLRRHVSASLQLRPLLSPASLPVLQQKSLQSSFMSSRLNKATRIG